MDKELFNLILKARPQAHMDERFSARLRARLVQKQTRPIISPYNLSITELRYSAFGALIAVIFVAPLTFLLTRSNPAFLGDITPLVKNISSGLSPTQQIAPRGSNAFGTISPLALAPQGDLAANQTMNRAGIAAATGPVESATNTVAVEYVGDTSVFATRQGTVLKRTVDKDAADQLVNLVKNTGFGLTDLSTFSDLSFSTINLKEETPYGYALAVDFAAGEISIMPHWEQWPTATDTPAVATTSSEDLVSIANAFLDTHKMHRSSYGQPMLSPSESNTVIYPMILDSKRVVDQDGSAYGLKVTVDAKEKRVSTVANLTSQTYESSTYALETDKASILAAAQALIATTVDVSSLGTSTLRLATPERVLMRYVQYGNGTSSELYMPALKFEAANAAVSVVVPLIASSTVPAVR